MGTKKNIVLHCTKDTLPEKIFEFSTELPSGRSMKGTIVIRGAQGRIELQEFPRLTEQQQDCINGQA